jgi:hypothetical protein
MSTQEKYDAMIQAGKQGDLEAYVTEFNQRYQAWQRRISAHELGDRI